MAKYKGIKPAYGRVARFRRDNKYYKMSKGLAARFAAVAGITFLASTSALSPVETIAKASLDTTTRLDIANLDNAPARKGDRLAVFAPGPIAVKTQSIIGAPIVTTTFRPAPPKINSPLPIELTPEAEEVLETVTAAPAFAVCASPVSTPSPGGNLKKKLAASAPIMKQLKLTPESVLAVHNNCDITVRSYLADVDAQKLPPVKFFDQFKEGLAKYGFTRLPIKYTNKDVAITVRAESSGWPMAVSRADAMGLTQFVPGTIADYPHNPFDPEASAKASQNYIADLKSDYGSNWRIAYNWGPGNLESHMRRHGGVVNNCALPGETLAYIKGSCKPQTAGERVWRKIWRATAKPS